MRTLRALPVCGAPSDLSTVLQDTWRCFSWSELTSIASDHAARRALSDGHVVRLAPNAYCGAMHARSFAARADAVASWLHGVAVLGGASSLYVARVIDEPPHLVDVTVKSSTSIASRPPWLRVTHASYALETAVIGGWTVAHPAMALCQAYGRLSVTERDTVVLRAFQTRRLSADDVRAALARMPRVKDRRALERVVRAFERGAESVLEMRALDEVFAGPEWSELVRQHDVTTRAGRFRLDAYHAATKTAFEFDGAAYHVDPTRWQRDRNRDAELAAVGIQVVRFTSHDLTAAPEWCRDIVRRVLRARRRG